MTTGYRKPCYPNTCVPFQQKIADIYTTITFDAVLLKSNPLHSLPWAKISIRQPQRAF